MGRADETIAHILEQAIKIIAKNGIENFTFLLLAEKSGISRQMLHRYFKSREEVILQCFDRIRDDFQKDTIEVITPILDPVERLKKYSDYMFDWTDKHHTKAVVLMAFLQKCMSDKKLQQVNTEFVASGTNRIIAMLQAIKPEPSIDSLYDQAKAIQNLITGSIVVTKTETIDTKKIKSLTWKMISKIVLMLIFVMAPNFFSSADGAGVNNADPSPEPFEFGICDLFRLPTRVIPERHFYRPFAFLDHPSSGFQKVSKKEVPIQIDAHGFYRAGVTREFADPAFIMKVHSVELRPGFPDEFFNHVRAETRWPRDPDGSYYGQSRSQYYTPETFLNFAINSRRIPLVETIRLRKSMVDIASVGFAQFQKAIDQIADSAIERYKRRDDWDLEAIEGFRRVTYDYQHRTIFVEVASKETGKNVATIIFVLAPFGERVDLLVEGADAYKKRQVFLGQFGWIKSFMLPLYPLEFITPLEEQFAKAQNLGVLNGKNDLGLLRLPMEQRGFPIERRAVHGQQYPVMIGGQQYMTSWGDGVAIEPRLFTIDKSVHDEAYVRLSIAMFSMMNDPFFTAKFNADGLHFSSLSDRPRMYERLGFKRTGPPQIIRGIKSPMYPLHAPPTDILNALEAISKTLKSNDATRVAELIRSFKEAHAD